MKAKQQGPKKMQIERPGRVRKEVAKIDAKGDPGNEIVGAPDVMNAAPKPNAPRPPPAPKPAPKKEAPKAGKKAPPRVFTAAEEAKMEQDRIDKTVRDNKAGRSAKIAAMREHIKNTREGRVGPERSAAKAKDKLGAKGGGVKKHTGGKQCLHLDHAAWIWCTPLLPRCLDRG